jgi:Rha family phage regulatory protein
MGGKHIHVHYGNEHENLHVVAATPSDWRAPLNERSLIRRELRRLGLVDEDQTPARNAVVVLRDGSPTCTSYDVAESFSKAHKDVLRAIDRIREECGPEFDRRNFAPIDYKDAKGRTYRAFSMTRGGFTLVVMSFTGRAATEWKVKYIDAFNALEAEIARLSNGGEIAQLRAEMDALVSLMGEVETKAIPPPQRVRKAPFVRPSVLRRMRRR